MLERLLPHSLIRHHFASLTDRSDSRAKSKPDWPVIVVLVGTPTTVLFLTWYQGLQLAAPSAVLGALSLLSAGLLASFGQIAAIRGKYRLPETNYDPEWRVRAMLDEAVAHILTAALLAVSTAVLIVSGMNLGDGTSDKLATWCTPLVMGAGTYLVIVFFMVVRKLWAAYETANERQATNQYLHD